MPFYERGPVRIHYEEVGSGFPLLVIPGGGLNGNIRRSTSTRSSSTRGASSRLTNRSEPSNPKRGRSARGGSRSSIRRLAGARPTIQDHELAGEGRTDPLRIRRAREGQEG